MPAVADRPLSLAAGSAADLMRGDIASIPQNATFQEALAFFIDRNVTVAPVVGDRDQPVGVLSVIDLLIHVRASAVPVWAVIIRAMPRLPILKVVRMLFALRH